MNDTYPKIFLSLANLEGLKVIANQFSDLYIDGTLYNSGSGMNLSCAGLKADTLAVFFDKVTQAEKDNALVYKVYMNSDRSLCPFPHDMKVWIDKDYLEEVESNELCDYFEIIIIDASCSPPSLYLQLR